MRVDPKIARVEDKEALEEVTQEMWHPMCPQRCIPLLIDRSNARYDRSAIDRWADDGGQEVR